MIITKTISPETVIKRLKGYCERKGYTVSTKDPTALDLQDNILQCYNRSVTNPAADSYTVHGSYNGASMTVAHGSLIEMAYDLERLDEDEIMSTDVIMVGDDFINRRNVVRPPWDRSAD